MRIVRWRAGPGIVQFDLVEVRLGVQRPGDELRPVVDLDFIRYIFDTGASIFACYNAKAVGSSVQ